MKLFRLLGLSALIVGSGFGASITGQLWAVSDSVAQHAVLASVPATAPNVTFQVSSPLNFTGPGSVQQFLLSSGATNITGSASDLSRSISPSLIEFKGGVTVSNGQTFAVTHDDGLTLVIGGLTVIGASGPTAPRLTNVTYNGPSGTFPFTLVYGECCAGQAVLQVNLPFQPSVPEPASYATVAAGLILIGTVRKMRRKA